MVERAVNRPYDIPFNVAVWMAFKPIIKIYLSIGVGFLLAKKNILTPQLSKGVSQLILLILMPALIFNNIVSNIKDTMIKEFGVIILTGFIYYVVGLGYGYIVYLVSPIPRAWFGGLLLCCMLNNCSDLPLAYVQAIGAAPVMPSGAASLGQSYCVLFVIIFVIFCFNLGGSRLVEWDATRDDPHGEEPTVPVLSPSGIYHRFQGWFGKKVKPSLSSSRQSGSDQSDRKKERESDLEEQGSIDTNEPPAIYSDDCHMVRVGRTLTSESAIRARRERPVGTADAYYTIPVYDPDDSEEEDVYLDAPQASEIDTDAPVAYQNLNYLRNQKDNDTQSLKTHKSADHPKTKWQSMRRKWYQAKKKNKFTKFALNFLEDMTMPQMMSLISACIVCFIPWVRRVFVKGQDIAHFHDAPDDMPPLDFIMEFLSFFGAAQVPLGLMMLGGTMANLKIGKMVKGFWRTLALICIFKLALLPIIGCAWIHRIREIGWIAMDDPMTPIVLAVGAGTPSATVQIYLTLAWIDPTKESIVLNCLAISLMAQYLFLPITLTFLMTYVIMHYV